MSVGRICARQVTVAMRDENVAVAARRMLEQRVGTLVVLSDTKQPIGMVTDRDLVLRVLAAGKDPQTTSVHDVMTRDPQVVGEDTPIESALTLMRTGSFRRIPVVNRERELVGILSLDDVLALIAEEFTHIGAILEQQEP